MAVAAWFEIYVRRPQRDGHLKGQRPIDVFSQGQGPGVNPIELRELMMSMEIRTIRRRGISFLGEWYYSPALYGRKHPVIIKYDLQDNRSLFVYRGKEFICEARRISDVHPAADILGTEDDQAMLRDQLGMKKSLGKRTVSSARELLNTVIIPETTRQIESAGFALKKGSGSKGQTDKVKDLPLTQEDKARIEAEYENLDKHNKAMEHIAWENLHTLSDMDRYEKLLEYEAQGVMVPRDEQGFMRYFEQTEQYTRFADYFEEFRTKMVMMYQT